MNANLAAAALRLDPEVPLFAESDVSFGEPRAGQPTLQAAPAAPAATLQFDQPRAVILQVAERIRTAQEQAIELKLHPEELGRVRMTLTMDHGNLSVALTAERGETLDLLRRNIDILGGELRRIGYGNVDFSFGDGRQQPGTGSSPSTATADEWGEAPTGFDQPDHPNDPDTRPLPQSGGGVDIRI